MLLPHMWLRKFYLRRALRDYPLYDPPHKVEEYLLSREQAIHLARVLLAAAQEWDEMEVTAWRVYKRQSDNTYNVTVTTAVAVDGDRAYRDEEA